MTLYDKLRLLFSRNVIISRQPGNRLKVIDVNMSQANGSETAKSYDRYKWANKNHTQISGWAAGGNNVLSIESTRRTAYDDYDIMDHDAIITSALDIYADECVVKDMNSMIVNIKTQDENIQKILYNLFYDVLNIEFNLWYWVRSAIKYGDFFLYLMMKDKIGIINVIPIHPSAMEREEGFDENYPTVARFKYTGDGRVADSKNVFEEFQIAHFRMMTDPNMLPYGKSILEGARIEYKKLVLLEDAMLLSRIMRAPERRIFKVDIGNIHPNEVDSFMKDFINSIKKVPYIDETTGQYNLKYNLMTMLDDYYLPVRGSDNGTSIDTLPGLQNANQIDDIEYTKSKLIAALKVPKPWLGFDEASEAKSNLASIDIRFGKTVERVQKIIISELYKIAIIHLAAQGYTNEEILDFELELCNPSVIYKRQQIDLLNEKMTLVQAMMETNLFSRKYIYEQIFDMSDDEWKRMLDDITEDKKLDFRYEQIKTEGNDPKVTGKSFGTPFDLVAMQRTSAVPSDKVKHLYTVDGREDNEGQPKKGGSFGTDRDPSFGRDPDGGKGVQSGANPNMEHIIRMVSRESAMRKTLLTENEDESNDIKMLDDKLIHEIQSTVKSIV